MSDTAEQIALQAWDNCFGCSLTDIDCIRYVVAALRDAGLLRDEPEPAERRTDWHTGLSEYRPTEGSD